MTQQRSQHDPILQQRILLVAQQEGDDVASERFAVPKGTIRSWRYRAKQGLGGLVTPDKETVASSSAKRKVADAAKPGARVSGEMSVEQLRADVRSSHKAMTAALKRLQEILPGAKSPQQLAIVIGVLHDKSVAMAALIQSLEEADVRVSEDQARLIVTVLEAFFVAAGVPVTAAGRAAMSELLRQASEKGAVLAVSPATAEQLQGEVLGHFERLIGRKRAEDGSQVPLLPAGEIVDGEIEADRVSTVDTLPDDEPDDAEVVEGIPEEWPPGWFESYGPDREAAAQAYERYRAAREALRRQSEQRQVQWNVGGGFGSQIADLNRGPNF